MKKICLCAMMLVFGMVGSASATIVIDDNFNGGLGLPWTVTGDVVLANAGLSYTSSSPFITSQGMNGNYALLGHGGDDSLPAILEQSFSVSGYDTLTISFNYAFRYTDFTSSGYDEFLSLVSKQGATPLTITFQDLITNGSYEIADNGIVFGTINQTVNISAFTSNNADVMFKLIQYGEGTTSSVGIDNVKVTIPEPAATLLIGIGLAGLVGYSRKRFSKKA
ncbi:PEP-CTERM sorting domain-containing protein [Desulfopila sp. IMCC35006]|uniref:PEP-CTERM sorting domain-containing protein n=1 Tax=Desulfopila sp. IMCC35006 TaxID=2569542 RepID=UPI0010ABBF9E|nr:PEP-CTERM sorting domain-containing protein [Desulfopila sp. IMCC35006]TKB25011.1 PEP-CTERM sorting domain-containing protein [Desulfopila sp. IMCC35006]